MVHTIFGELQIVLKIIISNSDVQPSTDLPGYPPIADIHTFLCIVCEDVLHNTVAFCEWKCNAIYNIDAVICSLYTQ